jgi:hypothetical protein
MNQRRSLLKAGLAGALAGGLALSPEDLSLAE